MKLLAGEYSMRYLEGEKMNPRVFSIFSAIKQRVRERKKGPWSIETSSSEAVLLKRGSRVDSICWRDVDAITAYKADRFTWDPIVIVLWHGEKGVPFEEFVPGYQSFQKKIEELWPQIDKEWASRVNKGAFAPNPEVLWSRGE